MDEWPAGVPQRVGREAPASQWRVFSAALDRPAEIKPAVRELMRRSPPK
jgi:uncharacterized protein (DUF1778 family)